MIKHHKKLLIEASVITLLLMPRVGSFEECANLNEKGGVK